MSSHLEEESRSFTAFMGDRRIALGTLAEVVSQVRGHLPEAQRWGVLIYDDETGALAEADFRDQPGAASAPAEPSRGRGRPKLGVVPREVTLLPRHWDWLAAQPGGASVALRKLVEEARRANSGADRQRRSREAAYKFMHSAAGDRPGYEEAIRGLFAGDRAAFEQHLASWPEDLRAYAERLAGEAW